MQALRSHDPTAARTLVRAPRSRAAPGTARPTLRTLTTARQQDRDHPAGRPFDDPHLTPPPHGPPSRPPAPPTTASGDSFAAHQPAGRSGAGEPPSSWTFSSLATSDLELGNDPVTGSTLETPEQLESDRRKAAARLAQADAAREAGEAREAAQGVARLVLEGLREEQRAAAAAVPAPKEDEISDALFMNASDAEEARAEAAAAAAQARANLAADESTAAEREAGRPAPWLLLTHDTFQHTPKDRYQGILQAIDSLGATEHRGASDPEDETHSPEAARLLSSTEADQAAASFDAIRHTVDELGEGEEAAKLIAESYKGRNLDAEVLGTVDPSDPMPHPGDRYLGRSALPSRAAAPGGMTPHLNQDRSHFERRPGPLLPPARGGSAGQGQHRMGGAAAAWLPPGDASAAARAGHAPVGGEEEEGAAAAAARQVGEEEADDQIGLLEGLEGRATSGVPPPPPAAAAAGAGPGSGVGADDQIDYEQDALRGADALYYAPEHAAQPSVNDAGMRGGGAGGNVEAPEEWGVEGDALRGSDSMFYFKAQSPHDGGSRGASGAASLFYFKGGRGARRPPPGEGAQADPAARPEHQQGTVWGALTSRDEEHSSFRRAVEEAAAEASSHGLAAAYRSATRRRAAPGQGAGGAPELGRQAAVRAAAAGQLAPGAALGRAASGSASQQAASQGGAAGANDRSKPRKPAHGEGILASLRRRQEDKRAAEQSMGLLAGRLRGGRGPGGPEPPASSGRVLEVATGRSAVAGLLAAAVTEVVTQQSVLSQLLGRFEGPHQMEVALPMARALAIGVLAASVALGFVERAAGRGSSPFFRPLGLAPAAQLWLGRAAMALWVALIAYETVHSNRPALGTLFYLWF